MTLQNPDGFVGVLLPVELYEELVCRYPRGVSAVLTDVTRDFLDRTRDDWQRMKNRRDGIQWGPLFLPTGTQLRTRYFGEYRSVSVRGDRLIGDSGEFSSVAQAANALRGKTSNNAWIVMEIKRPGDAEWVLADTLRKDAGGHARGSAVVGASRANGEARLCGLAL